MINLGLLAFAHPWLLLALIGLPVLWLLLRLTPPAPRRVAFPAIRLLAGLRVPEETPARTPWWLLLLRLMIAALVILGLAQPLLNPAAQLSGSGPMIMVIDDGWSAARFWQARQVIGGKLLAQAEREGRAAVILTTARDAQGEPAATTGLLPAAEAQRILQGLRPKPWPNDRATVLETLGDLEIDGSAHVVWLSDGLGDADSAALATALQRLGRLHILREEGSALAHLALAPDTEGVDLVARALRADAGGPGRAEALALGADGRILAKAPLLFAPGEAEARALLDLPTEMRNRIARIAIEGEATAGAVVLLDERWRRRPVGLVAPGSQQEGQPLLSESYYLERALEPFTELRQGNVEELLQRDLAVLVLPDAVSLSPRERDAVAAWVDRGGLLLRFAGPHTVSQSNNDLANSAPPSSVADDLLPVRLRGGDRILGGALTWDTPAQLAPFASDSPFAEIVLPEDVLIRRQVLAEPSLDLAEKTWARLADGTPLVTADRRGGGWLVLFHTTANTDWSNLPISGLFVEMLRRVMAVSQGISGGTGGEALPPIEVMDGFGSLGAPPATVLALEPGTGAPATISPQHPPGYYGNDSLRQAHNMSNSITALEPLKELPAGVTSGLYHESPEQDLKPWLLAAALILALADLLISLRLRGLLPVPRKRAAAAAGALIGPLLLAAAVYGFTPLSPAAAQNSESLGAEGLATDDGRALEATLMTRLAFVETGSNGIDEISRAGLAGLTRVLERRTSVEAGPPLGVVLGRDDLSFFPLIYWPITDEQADLDAGSIEQVNSYLENGGTILFDLREASSGMQLFGATSRGTRNLQRLTRGLSIPALEPVPTGHVLRKSFYLMEDFPGRFAGGTLWLEAQSENINDGVASVLIGSNDWVGAWAVNRLGRPLNAVVPGGPRQREMAYRFGVNLVMYALTGNYKADQVHIPFILERLGQ
ncbi:DUF4159 domain-containing protein [Pelagibius litoralis]|uniref:DUF4159 domain-containing protein n=1 Tax=Pelagibius litoralis TaxID=374515 RepID=A0A967F277_9PROT|nr:DUF4159 domain-containing protein [Pelagibius litoralis]NIA71642.1 DUF4159 domain-containing protein [Pelagibius litoralis]